MDDLTSKITELHEKQQARNANKPTILDEKGFVFLDLNSRPYWCRIWGGKPWLFYWHAENHWVSLRETNQNEIWNMPAALPPEQAEMYHSLHRKWENE